MPPLRRSPWARPVAVLLAVLPLVLNGLLLSGPAAAAVGSGSIAGTVTSASGDALGDIRVLAYQPGTPTGTWSYAGDSYTSADGSYRLDSLTPGPHRLYVVDESSTYVPEYFDDAKTVETATSIPVLDGQTTADIDVALETYGHITGTVRRTDGAALDNILVEAMVPREGGGWTPVEGDITGADGTYDLAALPTGDYRVRFLDHGHQFLEQYLTESYDDAPTLDEARDVAVVEGATTADIDAVLEREGILGGTVTNTFGEPLGNIQVQAFEDVDPGAGTSWVSRHAFTVTGEDGGYAITLPTGEYRLYFSHRPGADSTYLPEYYDDAATLETAQDVTVTNEQTTTVPDVDLALGARISGTLLDGSGAPVWGIWTTAYRQEQDESGGTTWTRAASELQTEQGGYSLGGLEPGTYRIGFTNADYSAGYVPEFYDDAPTLAGATDIIVAAEGHASGRDAVLTATATISGNVTQPLFSSRRVRVEAYRSPDGGDTWELAETYAGSAAVDSYANGDYSIRGLPPGTYRIKFDEDAPGELKTEYYDDVATIEAATDITVVEGETRRLTDTVLAEEPSVENVGAPSIVGTARVGDTLTALDGEWEPAAATLTRQWLADGEAIPGATGSTFVPGVAELGQRISLRVTGTRDGYDTGEATSDETAPVAKGSVSATDPPRVSGSPLLGGTLRARTGTWAPGGLVFSYRWLRNGEPIRNATGSTYDPRAGDLGKTLSVKVTGTKPGYVTLTETSAPTGTVRSTSTTEVSAHPGHRRVTFEITVTARKVTPSGTVVVQRGAKTLKTLELEDGTATVTLTRQRRGTHTYSFNYSGSARATESRLTKRVTID